MSLPPSDFLVAAGFPEAYHFCDLGTVPDSIKSLVKGRSGITGMEVGKQYTPEEFLPLDMGYCIPWLEMPISSDC